ncbi:MAG: hypothetical protein JO067_06535 [Cupriavidus sp.]|nr:hypothetical protein [Cupriavidus sp.]
MAKASPINIENELIDAKSRRGFGFAEGAYYEAISRLASLDRSLAKLKNNGDKELYRYFPVAAIAVLETHFKVIVATVIDSGPPYLERGLNLVRDKLMSAADALPLLHRKNISAGDIVSHSLPFNSIASLERAYCALFDKDLKNVVQQIEDPYVIRTGLESRGPIVPDVITLWAGLARTFERRHILAHESAEQFSISYEESREAVTCVTEFVKAIDAILWETIWKDRPLTQYEMNVSAGKELRDARDVLAARMRKALKIATEDGQRARFRRMHFSRRAYFKQWIEWQDEQFTAGSIRPLLTANGRTLALKCYIKELSNWIGQMRFEEPPEEDIDF